MICFSKERGILLVCLKPKAEETAGAKPTAEVEKREEAEQIRASFSPATKSPSAAPWDELPPDVTLRGAAGQKGRSSAAPDVPSACRRQPSGKEKQPQGQDCALGYAHLPLWAFQLHEHLGYDLSIKGKVRITAVKRV